MATFDSSGIDAWVTENNPSMPMYAINSSVQKSNGKRILLQENITMFVNVALSTHLHHVEEWYTFTLKRTYVLIPRTEEWNDTYKIRTTVECSINHFKNSFGIASRKTQNEKTLHADLILASITQLISVILADKLERHPYIRSLKPLII